MKGVAQMKFIHSNNVGLRAALIAAFLGTLLAGPAHAQIFVANTNAGTINEYNLDGTPVGTGILVSGLNHPSGLALSGSNLFVTTGSGTIGEYTTSGGTVNASLVSALNGPGGIAVS